MTTDHSSNRPPSDELLDEAERLIWASLDGQLEPEDARRLKALLEENQQVRQRYLECVQIHVDLREHFAGKPSAKPNSPVLGSLGDLRPDNETRPPVSE